MLFFVLSPVMHIIFSLSFPMYACKTIGTCSN
jgi:hypothetical protein